MVRKPRRTRSAAIVENLDPNPPGGRPDGHVNTAAVAPGRRVPHSIRDDLRHNKVQVIDVHGFHRSDPLANLRADGPDVELPVPLPRHPPSGDGIPHHHRTPAAI
ncbi:hypothetical protein FHU30_003971 [Actinomadura rupiterrae]|nr:hypothetical protein [Actinomadura rupiterrae]MCP2338616.1 hypothetical protein [Actinomadura rupiterrae]